MRRVAVVGCTSAGKSTLGQELSHRLGVPFVDLDVLYWGPGWTPLPDFRERVAAAVEEPGWVIAGSYMMVKDLIWRSADTVVWLDYGLLTIFWRLLRRTLRRWWKREQLFGGNRESLWTHLCTRDSLFWWLLTTYGPRRREYAQAAREHPHLNVQRHRTPAQTRRWLLSLGPPGR